MSGDIVVSGVLCSSYVAHILDYKSTAAFQKYAQHLFLAPLRMLCTLNMEFCRNETYDYLGYSNFFSSILHVMFFVKKFGVLAQIAAIAFAAFVPYLFTRLASVVVSHVKNCI